MYSRIQGHGCHRCAPRKPRADRRVAGAGCGKCNHRVLAPGETDVASRYPDIAIDWNMASNEGLGPHQVMPGTTLRNWKCVFGHSTRQSVPNRVKSCGCTKCEPELRSAWLRKM
ncbi:zinc-ribbon domain-containing protein [Glaciihabitans sp. UYNi722]|uniref:zinc-ribbon domain-containing protein n=1 Tax=Glaciihabitans sp. UYNi722 TaxID=3156344 RepID=UPI003394ED25